LVKIFFFFLGSFFPSNFNTYFFFCYLISVVQISAMAEEAGMFMVTQTIGSVLCCKCGIPMAPNSANMCVKCLHSEVDITEGLQKNVIIIHCPECDAYLQPPRTWVKAQLESKELLTF
jgi:nonsense-mediated mRNA decay protein 3